MIERAERVPATAAAYPPASLLQNKRGYAKSNLTFRTLCIQAVISVFGARQSGPVVLYYRRLEIDLISINIRDILHLL